MSSFTLIITINQATDYTQWDWVVIVVALLYPWSFCPGGVLETFSLDQGQWNDIFIYLVQPSVALCPFRCTLFRGDKKGQTGMQASLSSAVMFRCTSIHEQCPRVSNRSRRPSAIYDTFWSPLSPLSPFFLLTSGAPFIVTEPRACDDDFNGLYPEISKQLGGDQDMNIQRTKWKKVKL